MKSNLVFVIVVVVFSPSRHCVVLLRKLLVMIRGLTETVGLRLIAAAVLDDM